MPCYDRRERCGVQDKEDGSENRSLGDTVRDKVRIRGLVLYNDRLSATSEVRSKPMKNSVLNTKVVLKAF